MGRTGSGGQRNPQGRDSDGDAGRLEVGLAHTEMEEAKATRVGL